MRQKTDSFRKKAKMEIIPQRTTASLGEKVRKGKSFGCTQMESVWMEVIDKRIELLRRSEPLLFSFHAVR